MTRASVVIKRNDEELFLYKNGDGYPSGLGKDLIEFLDFDNFDLFKLLATCELQLEEEIPSDAEYLYTIDLNKRTFTIEKLD